GQFSALTGSGNLHITANPNGVTTDISTGIVFNGSYSAVSGSSVINPLTTLIVAAGGNQSLVKTALGLDSSLDLNTYDPLASVLAAGSNAVAKALAIKVQSTTIQIANLIAVIASVTKADGAEAGTITSVAQSVATTLMAAANTSVSGTINLADSTLLESAINKALSSVFTDTTQLDKLSTLATSTATAVALVNSKIEISSTTASNNAQNGGTVDAISTLQEIVSAQIVAQQTIAQQAANVVQNPTATITVNASNVDAQITSASADVKQLFVNTGTNIAPTLSAFASTVATGNEDSKIVVTFANLQTQGNEADVDGTVTAFVIKAVSTGTLTIGTSADTASAWDATTNNSIDATHQAYWTPVANANGTLNAFTAVAKDNGGLESATLIQVTVAVTAVNDAPTGSITINGSATQGQTLTAANNLVDIDGLGTISYQWLANGTAISGATAATLTLTQAQVDKTITVTAGYTDLLGTPEIVTSTATTAVVNVNDAPTTS
ncbi:beta strand repeat-containing protein, partial [Methylobacter psychrophilus]|uniref:beta strand repeat-containing protein n=1 Tax=Methylobacter psychrophilus TaxID=96941 RepID=UPI0021D4DC53